MPSRNPQTRHTLSDDELTVLKVRAAREGVPLHVIVTRGLRYYLKRILPRQRGGK